jgi:predicted NBD/HSP70 family sugar kinase
MMEKLLDRGQALAGDAQQRKLAEVAGQLRAMFGNAVEIEGDRVLVSGRGIMKRWLIDPSLRFLGGLK